jgi:hypothetical protein
MLWWIIGRNGHHQGRQGRRQSRECRGREIGENLQKGLGKKTEKQTQ